MAKINNLLSKEAMSSQYSFYSAIFSTLDSSGREDSVELTSKRFLTINL